MTDAQNPVAWHITGDGYEYATLLEEHARAIVAEEGGEATPLYRSPALTDEEREAIAWAALAFGNKAEELGRQHDVWVRLMRAELTLRSLLARLS